MLGSNLISWGANDQFDDCAYKFIDVAYVKTAGEEF